MPGDVEIVLALGDLTQVQIGDLYALPLIIRTGENAAHGVDDDAAAAECSLPDVRNLWCVALDSWRQPMTIHLFKYEVQPQHMETFRDRLSRGAVSPRHWFEARPGDWTYVPYAKEPKDAPGNPHEWGIVWK